MTRLAKSALRFLHDEQATETLEWGLVCGLLVASALGAITLIGPRVKTIWNTMSQKTAPAPSP